MTTALSGIINDLSSSLVKVFNSGKSLGGISVPF